MYSIYIFVFNIIFIMGVIGVIRNRGSILQILVCMEIRLLGVNLIVRLDSVVLDDLYGQLIGFMILVLAGGEAGVGLALLVVYYRVHGEICMESMNMLHG